MGWILDLFSNINLAPELTAKLGEDNSLREPIEESRRKIEQWRVEYREYHPHSVLGLETPGVVEQKQWEANHICTIQRKVCVMTISFYAM